MSEHDRLSALILQRLAGSHSSSRSELAKLVVEQALEQRLRDVIDLERLRAAVLSVLTEANLRRIVDQHVAPGYARYVSAVASQAARVGSLVSPAAHQKLHGVVRALRLPRARWADHSLDPALVKQLLRPVWTQVLVNFANRLPIPGVSANGRGAAGTGASGAAGSNSASTVTGFIARSMQERAEKLIDRGRSAMGGIGAEVERRLTAAARDFSDTAAHAFRASLLERVQSDEGRELIGQILAGFTDHVLRTQFADLQADLNALPVAQILDLVPELVSFAARSGFVQEIVDRELEQWLALKGDRRLRELLEEYGLIADMRQTLIRRVDSVMAGAIATPTFAAWLNDLLRPDGEAE
jgi:hypothetical protein